MYVRRRGGEGGYRLEGEGAHARTLKDGTAWERAGRN